MCRACKLFLSEVAAGLKEVVSAEAEGEAGADGGIVREAEAWNLMGKPQGIPTTMNME